MASVNKALRNYIYTVAGDDIRYKNFLLAQGVTPQEVKTKSLYDKLVTLHQNRMMREAQFWNMYLGEHWTRLEDTETEGGIVKINHCALVVNKNLAFLMNKGFIVESEFPIIEKFLQKQYKLNNAGEKEQNIFGYKIGLNGSVTGNAFFGVYISKLPTTNEKYIKFEVFDTDKSFPVIQRKQLFGFLSYGAEQIVTGVTTGVPDFDMRYEGHYYSNGKRQTIVDDKVVSEELFDLTDIPIIHVQNFPLPSYYGMSDLVNIDDLNVLFDRILTDTQDIISYHASPVTLLYGANAGDLKRGVNKVWSLPKDSKMENLRLEGELTASNTFLEKIRESIGTIANIPEASTGKQMSISNTSAASLAITLMPLYETMELKRIMYGSKLLEANKLMLKMAFLSDMVTPSKVIAEALDIWKKETSNYGDDVKQKYYPFSEKIDEGNLSRYDSISAINDGGLPPELYETFITWFPPLPRDEKLTADLAIANVNAKIWSLRQARLIQGLSERESLRMEREIQDDAEKIGTMSMTNAQPKVDAQGNPIKQKTGMEGNPDVKGMQESMRKQMMT